MAKSFLQCIRCSAMVDLYSKKTFECEKEVDGVPCEGLYEVVHEGNENLDADYLKNVFDGRTRAQYDDVLTQSGVWRFHELVMPSLQKKQVVSLGEGLQPFWKAGRHLREWLGREVDLWIMPEGLGPTGAFKDFGGTSMISVAKAMGVKMIGCSSTGDTSAMASAYAAAAGMECVVVLPKGQITDVQLMQPRIHGAKVVLVPGDFDDCMAIIRTLAREGRIFPANSINPTRIEGHQASAFLAAQFFDWKLPDWFVVPVGNGSNASSIDKGIRTLVDRGLVKKPAAILGAQVSAASPLASSWMRVERGGLVSLKDWKDRYASRQVPGETDATAMRITNPVSREKVMRAIASSGAMAIASEEELRAAMRIAGRDGFEVCPQTAVALAGLRNALEQRHVSAGTRIVLVGTASQSKFVSAATRASMELGSTVTARTKELAEVADLIGV